MGQGRDQIENLGESLGKQPEMGSSKWGHYARYWNGWTVVLKPLLLFLNLNQIRTFFFIAMSTLIVVLTCLLTRLEGVAAGSVIAAAFAAVSYPTACFSLSLSFCFFVALAASLVVVFRAAAAKRMGAVLLGDGRGWPLFFLVVGCTTAFFDFLCAPIVSLGMPLALLVFLSRREIDGMQVREILLIGFLCCASWAIGYAGLWVSKWVLSSLVLGQDIVSNAVSQLLYRTGETVAETSSSIPVTITASGAISKNFGVLFPKYALKLIGFGTACAIVIAIPRRKLLVGFTWRVLFSLVLVAVLPYLWYAAAANHSWVHYWFTYRGQLVALIAIGFAAVLVFERLFPGKDGAESRE